MDADEYFLGFARIALDSLRFDHRLVKLFQKSGCAHGNPEYAIRATISDVALREALEDSGVSSIPKEVSGSFEEVPLLDMGRVNGLDGLHRKSAGQRYLKQESDRWWLVRLYDRTLPNNVAAGLISDLSHQQRISDGDIFCNIRSSKADNTEAEIWWKQLTTGKAKALRKMLALPGFAAAFDLVQDIRALWTPIELGTLDLLLNMRCDEEILRAFQNVGSIWNGDIFNGVNEDVKCLLDCESIESIVGLAPGLSREDHQHLVDLMSSKKFLPKVKDQVQRQRLLTNLSGLRTMIPTLHSVIDNLKQLAPACEIMKRLSGGSRRQTIREAFISIYEHHSTAIAEYGEGVHRQCQWSTEAGQREFLYIQLWTACFRDFAYLSPHAPLKERGEPKPIVRRTNPALEQRLGLLALQTGFGTDTARRWSERDKEASLAEHFREDIEIGLGQAEARLLNRLALVLKEEVKPRNKPVGSIQFFDNMDFDIERRIGRPFDNDYQADRNTYFLLPLLQQPKRCDTSRTQITSSFARWNLLHEFFLWNLPDAELLLPVSVTDEDTTMHSTVRDEGRTPTATSLTNDQQLQNALALNETMTRRIEEQSAAFELERQRLADQLTTLRQTEGDRNRAIDELLKQANLEVSRQNAAIAETSRLKTAMEEARDQAFSEKNQAVGELTSLITIKEEACIERDRALNEVSLAHQEVSRLTEALKELQQENDDLKHAQYAEESDNNEEFERRAENNLLDIYNEMYGLRGIIDKMRTDARGILSVMAEDDHPDESLDIMATIQSSIEKTLHGLNELRTQNETLASENEILRSQKETQSSFIEEMTKQSTTNTTKIKDLQQELGNAQQSSSVQLAKKDEELERIKSKQRDIVEELVELKKRASDVSAQEADFQRRLQDLHDLIAVPPSSPQHDPLYFYIHCRSYDQPHFQTVHFERVSLDAVIDTVLRAIRDERSVRARKTNGSKKSKIMIQIRTNEMKLITLNENSALKDIAAATRAFWISSREPFLQRQELKLDSSGEDLPRKRGKVLPTNMGE